MVIDKLSDKLNIRVEKEKLQGLIGDCNINGEKVLFVKPLTYMNLSGNCVFEVLNFYKVSADDLIVIYDDIDHKYGIGFAGNKDIGEYDTLMEMLEAYLKEGFENGSNE